MPPAPTPSACPFSTPDGDTHISGRRTGTDLAGDLIALLRDPVTGLAHLNMKGDGPLLTLDSPNAQFTLVRDPALAVEILSRHTNKLGKGPVFAATREVLGNGTLTSEEPEHREHQRIVSPFFSPTHLEHYQARFDTIATDAVARWLEVGTIDIVEESAAVTLTAVLDCLFNVDPPAADQKRFIDEFSTSMEQFAAKRLLADASRLTGPPSSSDANRLDAAIFRTAQHAARLWSATLPAYDHDLAGIHQLPDRAIATRRAEPDPPDDLLSSLIDHLDGDKTPPLDAEQIRAEMLTMLLAGHETTTSTFAVCVAALSVAGDDFQRDAANNPQLLDQVIYEALRLYPPGWVIPRFALEDIAVGEHTLVAGTNVIIAPYLMHRSADLFDRPDVFDPSRWTAELRAHPPTGYLPFGAGSRGCTGRRFVLDQLRTLLGTMVSSASISGVVTMPDIECFFTLRPGPLPPATLTPRPVP